MSAETYHYLLYKKILEGLDAEEERQLNAWLNESEENRRAEAEVAAILQASALDAPPVDIPAELGALKRRLRTEAAPRPAAIRRPMWQWAAAAVLLLALGAVVWFQGSQTDTPKWVTVASGTAPDQLVELPDGSRVWLNSHSTLSYAPDFTGLPERLVHLEGEAFFEVEKDPAHPFVVEAGPCNVRVLGTAFNVRAWPNAPTCDVEVRSGEVRVSAHGQTADLMPGGRAVYDKKSEKLVETHQDTTWVAEWRKPGLFFQNMTLKTALERLSHRFGQPIELDNAALGPCSYSGNFPKADLNMVLANLKGTFHFDIIQTKEGWRLQGGRCPN